MRAALLLFAVLTLVPSAAWSQGNPLGPEFGVNTYTTNDQAQPSVAADSSGNFVVLWESQFQGGPGRSVFGQRYAGSGAPLGTEFRVNSFTLGYHSAPSIAADPAGNFVVIWQYAPLEAGGLIGQRYASSGVPLGGEFAIASQAYSYGPAAAADSAGNFFVVWNSLFQDGSGRSVFARRFASSGVPLGPEFRVNTYTTSHQGGPSVAADPSGNFVVVWQSTGQDGSNDGIFGQRYAGSGAPLGSEFRINAYTTGKQGAPSVAADSSGNFVVVWQSMGQDAFSDGVFGQRFASTGDPLGSEFRINTYTTGNQGAPSVAADSSGNFVVLWQSLGQDGSGDGVFGQRFAGSGDPLGPEFLVNTFTTNDQAEPSVAADSLGDFVVVWQSFAQDQSSYGVFGQRYRPILPVELIHFRME